MLEGHNKMKGEHINNKEQISDKNQCYLEQPSINDTIQLDKGKQERDLVEAKSNEIAEGLLQRNYWMCKSASDNVECKEYSLHRLEVMS